MIYFKLLKKINSNKNIIKNNSDIQNILDDFIIINPLASPWEGAPIKYWYANAEIPLPFRGQRNNIYYLFDIQVKYN